MSTQNNRIMDLALAGHEVGSIASLMGLTSAAVAAVVADTSQTPSAPQSQVAPAVSTLAPVTATALQDTTGLPSDIYVPITLHAAGTVTVAIGPTSSVATTIINAQDASLASTVHFRLPALWFFKVTVAGSAAIATGTVQVND